MRDTWKLAAAGTVGILLGASVVSLHSQDRASVVRGMKVLLENPQVRVQYHDVAVGETVPAHSHPAYVAYVLKPYKAKLRLQDGSERVVQRNPGEVFWSEAVTHSVENIGDNEIHNLIVELKTSPARD